MSNPHISSPSPSRSRKRFWRNVIITVVILGACAAITAALFGNTLRRMYHAHRGAEASKQAQAAIDAKDWKSAFEFAGLAWRHAPEEASTLRVLANLTSLSPSESRQAVLFWTKLLETGEATDSDLLGAARTFLKVGDPTLAQATLKRVSEAKRSSAEFNELQLSMMRGSGRTAEAASLVQNITDKAKGSSDPEERLRGVLLQLQNIDPLTREQTRRTLWEIAELKDDTGLRAATALYGIKNELSPAEKDRLRALLLSNPTSSDAQQFQAISLEIETNPTSKAQIIQREVEARLNQPIESLEEFFRWMTSEKEHEIVLQLLSFDEASKSEKIFPFYLAALIRSSKWAELEQALNSPKTLPIRQTQIDLIKVILARHKGGTIPQAEDQIRAVYKNCGATGDHFIVFLAASFAKDEGMMAVAREGFQSLVDSPSFRQQAMEALFAMARSAKDIDSLISVAKTASTSFTANERVAMQLAYLRLISGREMELTATAVRTAGEVPNSPAFSRLVLALYHLRAHNAEAMASVLASIDAVDLDAGPRCVYAGLLLRSNERVKAYRVFEKVPRSLLIHEELAFFESFTPSL